MNRGPLCVELPVLEMASAELEKMRSDKPYHSFPPACLAMLKSIKGNHRCIDCGEQDPQWATVSYGALLCLQCSGRHRSLGVQVSCVRSIAMDEWSQAEVLAMLEGGNEQLQEFFVRHDLTVDSDLTKNVLLTKDNVTTMRYKTKASLFYRQQMAKHVAKVLKSGAYRGREASRRQRRTLDHRNSSVL
jgi:ADP-ribosylation factor GTPase-activating protein 1